MPDSTVVLNKQYWNATVARTLDHGRDSGYEAVESCLRLDRPFHSRDVKNDILNIDDDNRFVGHRA